MSKIRIGVIGAGHLGRIHARLINGIEDAELVVVADPSPQAQKLLLEQLDVRIVSDYQKILDDIDAAVIATPTRYHFDVATECMNAGKHVLIEKPLTENAADAKALVEIANQKSCVVQVGHCERFNEAIRQAVQCVGQPKFIQAERLSGFTFRSTDIGVVHDLMVHDIDLVNDFFPGSLSGVQANGISVFGEKEDISQARLQFDCGGVANLTASRCSFEARRHMQLFGTDGYAQVDLSNHSVKSVRIPSWMKNRNFDFRATSIDQQDFIRENLFGKILEMKEVTVEPVNAILCEQQDWLACIRNGKQPTISIQAGCEAVEIADRVLTQIRDHAWSSGESMKGPLATQPTADLDEVPSELQVSEPQVQLA